MGRRAVLRRGVLNNVAAALFLLLAILIPGATWFHVVMALATAIEAGFAWMMFRILRRLSVRA
jgi:hypothetical protein